MGCEFLGWIGSGLGLRRIDLASEVGKLVEAHEFGGNSRGT